MNAPSRAAAHRFPNPRKTAALRVSLVCLVLLGICLALCPADPVRASSPFERSTV
jgi:hypothetical protein